MDSLRIEVLLEKYFEATTSLAEEAELKNYFTEGEVPAHLKEYIPLFRFYTNALEERAGKPEVLPAPMSQNRVWLSVAASVVVLIGVFSAKQYSDRQKAQTAYQQTRLALGLLARYLDRGTEKVAYISTFDQTTKKIYKNP
jgi:hypothetical protein